MKTYKQSGIDFHYENRQVDLHHFCRGGRAHKVIPLDTIIFFEYIYAQKKLYFCQILTTYIGKFCPICECKKRRRFSQINSNFWLVFHDIRQQNHRIAFISSHFLRRIASFGSAESISSLARIFVCWMSRTNVRMAARR